MTADAYRASAGEGGSAELSLAALAQRFGVRAVYGRETLYSYELRQILLAERVQRAYASRNKSDNWQAWAKANPADADLLGDIEARLNGEA